MYRSFPVGAGKCFVHSIVNLFSVKSSPSELHFICSLEITDESLEGGCVSGLPGTVHLNITLLWRNVNDTASSKRCIVCFVFFPSSPTCIRYVWHLKQEILLRKTPTVRYLLWREHGRHPTTEAIKVGKQQAKATEADEMPLWNLFSVFRNYNKSHDFSLAAKIRYHKHYAAETPTQCLKKIQEHEQQLEYWGLQKVSLIKILSTEISNLTTLDLVSSTPSASIYWWRAMREVEWIEAGHRFTRLQEGKGESTGSSILWKRSNFQNLNLN